MVTWTIFSLAIVIALAVDLGLHSKHLKPTVKSAVLWSIFWIFLALCFNAWIYFAEGKVPALNFLTSYLVEKALSVDNLFVFLVIFKTFQIPSELRHKVLFWGVVGAIVMRALFILGGIALVSHFSFVFYIFGLFLIYTAYKLAFQHEEELHPDQNLILSSIKKWIPLNTTIKSDHFFIKKEGKWFATNLFLALLAVEISDLVFALDSIPAVLGITTNLMIVFTSNIFAILGLRSLYFALEKTLDLFQHLHYGLAAILAFIGIKMLIADFYHVPTYQSLGFIGLAIMVSIGASLNKKK